MKKNILFACLFLIACDSPNIENKCRYKNALWIEVAECYKEYSMKLEQDIEILKLKMKYECQDTLK